MIQSDFLSVNGQAQSSSFRLLAWGGGAVIQSDFLSDGQAQSSSFRLLAWGGGAFKGD